MCHLHGNYKKDIEDYLSLHYVDIAQDHRWHWTYLYGKQIQGQKYGPKHGPSIKNIGTSSSFMHGIKKNILLHLKN